jgi:hypothetical protein
MLPDVNDFLLFAASEEEALTLRHMLSNLLDSLGFLRHPTMSLCKPPQVGNHRGIDIDTPSGYFYALTPQDRFASKTVNRTCGTQRVLAFRVPVKDLKSLAGQAQYTFLAIRAARFFLH